MPKDFQNYSFSRATKLLLLSAFPICLGHAYAAEKPRGVVTVEVDQGSVTLVLDESISTYKVEAAVDEKCPKTKVKMRGVGSRKVKIEHTGIQ